MSTITTNTEKELFIKMVLSNWELQISRMNNLLGKLSDEELSAQTAPDRNTGVYLLGHLAAVSDGLFIFLGLGEKLNPATDDIFLRNPDNSGIEKPSIAELKEYWNKVNALLADKISQIQSDEWFTRHTAVSEEDFAKEPHRNKLNIIINRTNHLSYHLGQLAYLDKK
ncbi:DinB family protein [Mucilaginibacter sp. McL0603]|uniref:DinB family protein n=1 Tax=Mucilaginibacter sp. McL0603 TaxID=3415670 RepID=UPI003CF2434A